MTNFSDLLIPETDLPSQELQERARVQLPALLRQHGLRIRNPEQPIPEVGTFLLIGVAAGYSKPDLALLDEISKVETTSVSVEIFDASQLKTMEDFNQFIPGIAPVYQTPVMGLWVDGELKVRKTGKEALEFIHDM